MKGLFIFIAVLLFLPVMAMSATWTEQMQRLATQTESKYNLPAGSCYAFAKQESGFNPYATRFETHYGLGGGRYARMVRSHATEWSRIWHGTPSMWTETVDCGKSWGIFQIMGINLRNLGYDGQYMNEILSDDGLAEQFEYFGRFVRDLRKRFPRLTDWIAAYNAGSPRRTRSGAYINQGYVNNILKYMEA